MAELSRTQQKRRMKRGSGRTQKIIIWSIISLALFVFGFAIYTYVKANEFLETIIVPDDPAIVEWDPDDKKYTEDPFAMVIIGLDSRAQTGSLNTDVLIVAVVEPETKNVTMFSIPRDTAVAIPGYTGYPKINAVYANGEMARRNAERKNEPITETGTSLLKKTIEGLFGIPVKHYITVDFDGFVKVIDDLDGIEVDVERNLVYHDPTDGTAINLEKGQQTLNGKKALDYVRHRQDDRGEKYWSSDFDRNRRQLLVINKVVDKMKSFTGITRIFDIMKTTSDHISTDLSKEKIKGLAVDFRSIGSENITTLETGAYWDSKIAKTIIPTEKLEEIRLLLWSKMGISEKEGRAKLLKENDLAVTNLMIEREKAAKESASQKKNHQASSSNSEAVTESDQNELTDTQQPTEEDSASSNTEDQESTP